MTYEPLRTQTSTRLLTIHPGISESPPLLSLQQVDLADGHSFEAISYAWGEPTLKKYVMIGDQKVLVWQNLWILLKRLRLPDRSRLVWIDALCIAQDDLNEKAHQVGIIDEIFKYATQVVAWVGHHDGSSKIIFRPPPKPQVNVEFREVSENKSGFGNVLRKSIGLSKEKQRLQEHQNRIAEEEYRIANEQLLQRSSAMLAFSQRDYFARQWIVQELAVAQNLTVYCGEDSESWSNLMVGFRRLQREAEAAEIELPSHPGPLYSKYFDESGRARKEPKTTRLPSKPATPLSDLYKLDDVRVNYHQQKKSDIFSLFWTFDRKLCANPVDRIYALLSLEKRGAGDRPLKIDYSIDVIDLTIEVIVERYSQIKDYFGIDGLMNLFALDAYQEMKVHFALWNRTKYYGSGSIPISFYNNCTRTENQYIRQYRISQKLQRYLTEKSAYKLEDWAKSHHESWVRRVYAQDSAIKDHKYGRKWAVMERKWKAKERLKKEGFLADAEE